jgi:hypothetical protein
MTERSISNAAWSHHEKEREQAVQDINPQESMPEHASEKEFVRTYVEIRAPSSSFFASFQFVAAIRENSCEHAEVLSLFQSNCSQKTAHFCVVKKQQTIEFAGVWLC